MLAAIPPPPLTSLHLGPIRVTLFGLVVAVAVLVGMIGWRSGSWASGVVGLLLTTARRERRAGSEGRSGCEGRQDVEPAAALAPGEREVADELS